MNCDVDIERESDDLRQSLNTFTLCPNLVHTLGITVALCAASQYDNWASLNPVLPGVSYELTVTFFQVVFLQIYLCFINEFR